MFQHDCLDTCSFECLICMCFFIFVFAPVQRNWACFTWNGALDIRFFFIIIMIVVVVVVVVKIPVNRYTWFRFRSVSVQYWGGQPPSWGQQASPSSIRRRRRRSAVLKSYKRHLWDNTLAADSLLFAANIFDMLGIRMIGAPGKNRGRKNCKLKEGTSVESEWPGRC